MVPQKQNAIIEDLNACIRSLTIFGFDYAINADKKDSSIPSEDIEEPLIKFLSFVVRSYKNDHQKLYRLYQSGGLWQKTIRDAFGMDDEDEKGYWFYHVYGIQPNILLKIHIEESFPIALEKILEMFERGYRKEFLELNIPIDEIKKADLFKHGLDEILNIIDERYQSNRLSELKATGKFFAWLYLLDKKKIEKVLQEYESVVDEDLQTIATVCRDTLQHEAPEQTSLKIA